MYGYVIFTDIEKYSSLKDADLKIFYNKVNPFIFEKLKIYKDSALIWNTWGDAIVAVYDKAENAINMAIEYRDIFNRLDFDRFGIKKLFPRIAGNFGEFESQYDSISGKTDIHGTLINITARIEPITLPGEIFVTKSFRDMATSSYDKVDNVRFDDMGDIKLPKDSGYLYLYRLCKKNEAPIKPVGQILFPSLNDPTLKQNVTETPAIEIPTEVTKESSLEKSIRERLSNTSKTENTENRQKKSLEDIKNSLKNDSNKEKNYKPQKKLNNYTNVETPIVMMEKSKINFVKFANNPFILAAIIFAASALINYLFDSNFTKDFFNWVGYYFNYFLYWLNSTFKTTMFVNPVSPDLIKMVDPWMWLRGYAISSFIISLYLTNISIKITNVRTIFFTVFIVGISQLMIYADSSHFVYSAENFLPFIQKFYPNILIQMLVCLSGLISGAEYASREKIEDDNDGIDIVFTNKYTT